MELKSALFKMFLFIVKQLNVSTWTSLVCVDEERPSVSLLCQLTGLNPRKKNALVFFPFNFYPSLYMVEFWVYRSFTSKLTISDQGRVSPKAFTIQPFRQYFTFVAKFRGNSVKRWKSLYVLMSYKYLSCFGSRVFSGCQSLALHVVVRIRGFYFLQEQNSLQKKNQLKQPNKKKGKNKLIWHKFQVLGIQLLWFSQASAVECKGAETIDLLCWIQQF